MRVVYLHQYFVTPEMSGGLRSFEMARRLVRAGHEVHMVTSDTTDTRKRTAWTESVVEGIHVHWAAVPYHNTMGYAGRLHAFFRFAWLAARRAASLHGDVVFATSTPLTIALPAVYAARRARCPMVFEVRDLWPAVPIAISALRSPVAIALARWLERFAYRNSTSVIGLAPGMRDAVVATGYPEDQVAVIPNGCDLDLFRADAPSAAGLRQHHSWLGDRPLVVFTGTFGLVNGMDYLVRLARAVQKHDPDVRFVAIGDGRKFESTRRLAGEAGVLDRTLFLLGRLPKTQTAAWVRAADMTLALFTGPEIVWRDAVQNKFFDSLAAGVPVANNFPGWQARIAEEAGAGLILDPSDTTAAAAGMIAALRDSDWLSKARASAKDLARHRFDWDLLAEDFIRVLEDAVAAYRQK